MTPSPDVVCYGFFRDTCRDLKVKNDFVLDLLGLGAAIKHRMVLAIKKPPVIASETHKIENFTALEEDLRRFKPPWITKTTLLGKEVHRLEGAELGTNALLAGYLRGRGFQAEVEVTLPSHRRCDLLLNGTIIVEAKPHLMSGGKLGSLMQEVISHKDLEKYSILIIIYGDVNSTLLNQLNTFLGVNFRVRVPVVYLGNLMEGDKYLL